MSWAHVQGTSAAMSSATTTLAATFGSSVTAGNLVVVGISSFDPTDVEVSTITDSVNGSGNPYTQAVVWNISDSHQYAALYYLVVPAGGSMTVTAHFTNTNTASISIDEYSFTGTSVSVESSGHNDDHNLAGSDTAPALISSLTVTGTDLVVAFLGLYGSATPTAGSGFTQRSTVARNAGIAEGLAIEDQLNVASSINPAFALSPGGTRYSMVGAAFKPAGGGGGVSLNVSAVSASGTTGGRSASLIAGTAAVSSSGTAGGKSASLITSTAAVSSSGTAGKQVASGPSWFNSSWSYRLPVTIDNTANTTSALSYYQLGISITGSAYTSFHANAKSDGSDLRVTDTDGTTQLGFALEEIDTANSAAYLLVKVPRVAAATSRAIHLYYGNSAATSVSSYATTVGPTTSITGPTDEWTQADNANFNANPVAVLLKNQGGVNGGGAGLNGKILCYLMVGANSNGDRTNGSLAVMSSTDGGVTYGSKTTLLAHTGTNTAEPRSVVELADGTILLAYSTDTFANSSAGKAKFYVAKSTDGGSTYSNLSITAPANVVTVPWTMGTDVGAPYGRMVEKTAGGDLFLPVYAHVTADTGWHSWLLKCPSGSDPTNGSNWATQGTIAFDNVNKFSETSVVQTTDNTHLAAIIRNDTTCDFYSSTSADSGVTWTTPTRLNFPGVVVNTFGGAVSPEIIKLASGNFLLCWGVRYGSDYGSTASVVSTDNCVTWLDRTPVATITGNTSTLWDGGYPTAVQNSDGTICVLAYRNTGALGTDNVFRMIYTEDYVVNAPNIVELCESFSSNFTSHGANATISTTHVLAGTNAVKIDNSSATGGTGDYVMMGLWPTNTALQVGRFALSFWTYNTSNDSQMAFQIKDPTAISTTGPTRVQVDVWGSTSNHVEWFNNATTWTDTGVAAPQNQWNKLTIQGNAQASTVTNGNILLNDAVLSPALGQNATGGAPRFFQPQGASVASTHNVIFWMDNVYTHQFVANVPSTTIGPEAVISVTGSGAASLVTLITAGTGAFMTPSSGAASLAALTALGAGAFTTTGSGAASLVTLVAAGSAGSGVFGSGAASLAALITAGMGAFMTPSSGAASLTALTALGAGAFTTTGSGAASLVTLVAAGSAGSGVFGSGAASLAALTVLGAGAFTARGSGAASLVTLVAGGSGTFSGTGGGGDLLVYPDPFGATVVVAIDPFGATMKLKGN